MKQAAKRRLHLVVRLWPEQYETEKALDDLAGVLTRQRNACDEVWFGVAHGVPSMEAHRQCAALVVKAAKRLRPLGILPGIQVGRTVGHGGDSLPPDQKLPGRTFVGLDGQPAPSCCCPRSTGLHEYLREMIAIYAECQPSSLWLDDDLRMHHHPPVTYGCFCDDCLSAFNLAGGARWTRESLAAALQSSGRDAVRVAWTAFNQESIATVCRAAAEAAHSAAPDCLLGFQTIGHEWGIYDGPDYGPAFAAYSAAGKHAIGSRPGHGVYNDHRPRELINKAFTVARQVARLPDTVTMVCPEVENFTHTAMGKTPHGTAVESTLDLALSGCNALSFAVTGVPHEPCKWWEDILERVARWRPFWERYWNDGVDTKAGGLEIVFGRTPPRPTLPADRPSMAWAHVDLSRIQQLVTMGLPLCTENQYPCAALLTAETADTLEDDAIRGFLSNGAILDGAALCRLQERGFGSLLGARAKPRRSGRTVERFTGDPLNGPNAGHAWMQTGSSFYQIEPTTDAARVLGEYEESPGNLAGAATVAVQTALGGRLAVLGSNGFEHIVSSARRAQILSLADWVSRGTLPVRIETPAQVMVVPRIDGHGCLKTVLFLNVTIDASPAISVELRGTKGTVFNWITPETGEEKLAAGKKGDGAIASIPSMPPWSLGYISAAPASEG
jgi:hypothetical protein